MANAKANAKAKGKTVEDKVKALEGEINTLKDSIVALYQGDYAKLRETLKIKA